jgi:hypothetical protein
MLDYSLIGSHDAYMTLRICEAFGYLETEIAMPRLTFLCKDEGSGGGGCPSIYLRDEDGLAIVQAQEADADTFGALLNVLPGERAVCIDPDVIVRAADMIRKRRTG